jgi:hypothetical protein
VNSGGPPLPTTSAAFYHGRCAQTPARGPVRSRHCPRALPFRLKGTARQGRARPPVGSDIPPSELDAFADAVERLRSANLIREARGPDALNTVDRQTILVSNLGAEVCRRCLGGGPSQPPGGSAPRRRGDARDDTSTLR